jgi:hypothetical protein
LGGLHNIDNQENLSDIEKREGSGGSKSQTPVEKEEVVIERIEKTVEGLRIVHNKGQNWISMG